MHEKNQWRGRIVPMLLAAGGNALAAGGHHGVDDAAILDPGVCELETWATRARGGTRLLHGGFGCRVGAVELGVASEYARQGGASQTGYEMQVKWAREVSEGLAIGASVTPQFAAHARPRYQGAFVSGLVSWSAAPNLMLHANVGREVLHGAPDHNRSGASVEWSPRDKWSLVAERYYEDRTHFARAGARWSISDSWTADISRVQRLRGPGESNWTVGTSWLFGKR